MYREGAHQRAKMPAPQNSWSLLNKRRGKWRKNKSLGKDLCESKQAFCFQDELSWFKDCWFCQGHEIILRCITVNQAWMNRMVPAWLLCVLSVSHTTNIPVNNQLHPLPDPESTISSLRAALFDLGWWRYAPATGCSAPRSSRKGLDNTKGYVWFDRCCHGV